MADAVDEVAAASFAAGGWGGCGCGCGCVNRHRAQRVRRAVHPQHLLHVADPEGVEAEVGCVVDVFALVYSFVFVFIFLAIALAAAAVGKVVGAELALFARGERGRVVARGGVAGEVVGFAWAREAVLAAVGAGVRRFGKGGFGGGGWGRRRGGRGTEEERLLEDAGGEDGGGCSWGEGGEGEEMGGRVGVLSGGGGG